MDGPGPASAASPPRPHGRTADDVTKRGGRPPTRRARVPLWRSGRRLIRAHELEDPGGTAPVSRANQAATRERMSRSSLVSSQKPSWLTQAGTLSCEVDPPWWSRPGFHSRLIPGRRIPLSSVVKWSIWSMLAAIQRNWPASLNRRRSRSAIGSRRQPLLCDQKSRWRERRL
jgi:hypothetical protein